MSQDPKHGQTQGSVRFQYNGSDVVLEILDLGWKKIEAEMIDVTNMRVKPTDPSSGNFGNKMKVKSIYVDGGQLVLRVQHDASSPIPIADPDPVDMLVNLGGFRTNQAEFDCLGMVQAYELVGPLNGKVVTADMVIEITDVTDTDDPNIYDDTGAVGFSPAT